MISRYLKSRQSGDTIIEVMAAITILGLALGAAFALSNRSYLTGVHTRDRTEALSLAQGQVEFLKDVGLTGNIGTLKAAYPNGEKFCFNDDTGDTVDAAGCTSYKNSIYNIAITYCSNPDAGCQENVFTVKADWIAGGTGNQNQLTIYYKAPQ